MPEYHFISQYDNYQYPVWQGLHSLVDLANRTRDKITELFPHQFGRQISLVCTGTSGLLIAYEIARDDGRFRIRYIKKYGENSHSVPTVFTEFDGPLIVVDDMIATGNTIRYIAKMLDQQSNDNKGRHKVVGLCLAYSNVDLITTVAQLFPNLQHVIH